MDDFVTWTDEPVETTPSSDGIKGLGIWILLGLLCTGIWYEVIKGIIKLSSQLTHHIH